MRDLLLTLDAWLAQAQPVALATVIQTWGSSPRQAGAKMASTPPSHMVGSVSGGCIEGAVVEASLETLATGQPQLLHFGVADETAWEVGLACGGSIEVFVQPLDPGFYRVVREQMAQTVPFASVTIVRGSAALLGKSLILNETQTLWGTLAPDLAQLAQTAAQAALRSEQTQRMQLTPEIELFIEVVLPPLTLIIVGGVHIAIALAALAKPLGYRTVVVDPRRAFGNDLRFPHVDELVQAWPDEALQRLALNRSTAVALLTHDPKFDDPGLLVALPSPAFYVGALGSRKTQEARRARLLEMGLTEAHLQRLHGPIGLDLGARTPEEIALSILAEIVATRNKRKA